MRLSDEQLALRLQGGEAAAFDELLARHQRGVYRLAYRFVGNHDDADDVAQETFVKVFTRIHQYRPPGGLGGQRSGRFRNWLYAIAVR